MRIDVKKTYKLYINGAFPRSESGRVFEIKNNKGEFIANPCLASRKDLRDAVVAARAAQVGWAKSTAYLRGQILYRIAEMAESRKDQLIAEVSAGEKITKAAATKLVEAAIDRWVWYAGWSDKLSSIFGATNQVSGPYYNFTIPEALGVVGVIAEEKPALLSLVRALAPVIAAGNTAVVIASESRPLTSITLAEVLATSDLPAGVINILTGKKTELIPWLSSHMEVDGIDISGADPKSDAEIKISGSDNLKRIHRFDKEVSPNRILAFMEYKTVWHPIGI